MAKKSVFEEKLNELLEVALTYQERGWSVLPIKPGSKQSFVKWKPYQEKPANPEQIKEWWRKWPAASIGLITGQVSGVIVLDSDGQEGEKSLREKGIPVTPCVRTKRGRHIYFKHPGFSVQSFVKREGLDLRADGGIVLLPPSIHSPGIRYEWLTSPTEEIAKAPAWLLELIKQKKEKPLPTRKPKKAKGKSKITPDIKPCIAHLLAASTEVRKRDNGFIVACELYRIGKTEAQIEAILRKLEVNEEKVGRIIKSVRKGIYLYKCEHLEKEGFCLFQDNQNDCSWYRKRKEEQRKNHKGTEEDFFIYGWDRKLKRTDRDLYLALKTMEIKRGYQAGARLFVSYNQIYEVCRVSRDTIKDKLKALRRTGLIRYIPGKKRVRGVRVKATEVWRIIPIPKPSNG